MEFKPLSGREFPRFSGLKTFFRLPVADLNQSFDVALFGIPYDGGVSYRPGARFAPSAVRQTSSLGRGFHMGKAVSVFESLKVADIGDCSVVPIDQTQTYEKIETFATEVLKSGKRFISCGGDHSTTLPLLRALKKHYKKPLNFIHFDAHLDTYPAAWGCEYHHGAFARHAVEEGLVNPKKMIQIGIRGPLAGGDDLEFIRKHKIKVYTVDDIRVKPLKNFCQTLPAFGEGPTFISFDVDCLDPAYAPGTGTPVVGGLTSYETQQILRALKIKNLVGGDVVEILPAMDHADVTSLIGVDVMFEMMVQMAQSTSAGKRSR
jgi:agmatinase/guanidinopropionase